MTTPRTSSRNALTLDLVGPYTGPCAFCGGPDARHRVFEAVQDEGAVYPVTTALYNGLTVEQVQAIVRAPRWRPPRRAS